MELLDPILESWDRQARIVTNIAGLITPDLMEIKSGEKEWSIGHHLSHIHIVRHEWLGEVAPDLAKDMEKLYTHKGGNEYEICMDLPTIKSTLAESASRIRQAMERQLPNPTPVGEYAHPLFFLQHMVWHEGWHVSSIIHALRTVNKEPTDEWEEENIWKVWRS